MPDYQLGKIYRIVCNTTGLNYYGSTCEPTLARRLAGHWGDFKLWKNGKLKTAIRSFRVLENNNYEIVLVEIFPCNSKMELHQRERFFIENNNCVNKVIPTRTLVEYKTDNKEILIEKKIIYSIENKDKIIQKNKIYNIENKQKIGENKKLYYSENKEIISENRKLYYSENREKLKEKRKETYECECGSIIVKSGHIHHDLTKKHIAFINNKTTIQHNILV